MSLNKVQLIGHLGTDPETKYTQGGLTICRLRVATTERRKGRDGNVTESTEWHTVKAFGKLGDICGELLGKGFHVYIEGRLHYDTFEKDGVKRHFTEILADKMDILGRPGESAPRTQRADPNEGRPSPAHPSSPPPPVDVDSYINDDDIPF